VPLEEEKKVLERIAKESSQYTNSIRTFIKYSLDPILNNEPTGKFRENKRDFEFYFDENCLMKKDAI
jgi:hypothetical protein